MVNKKDFEEELRFLRESLIKAKRELEELSKNVPDGTKLYSSRYGDSYQFFMKNNSQEKKGKYIQKKDRKTVEILAQIEYDEKLIQVLQRMILELDRCKENLPDNPFFYTMDQMNIGKRPFVRIPYVSDDDYVLLWKSQKYESIGFSDTSLIYESSKGLRVRSKSEIIIANMLDEFGIPFLYEKPLKLKSGIVHPDFTILDLQGRKEMYWEHFGMMDDIEYRNNAFYKIKSYEENGFYQSDSLIWTFETNKYPLNTHTLRKMMKALKNRLGYGD